jgi:hypothetical protein
MHNMKRIAKKKMQKKVYKCDLLVVTNVHTMHNMKRIGKKNLQKKVYKCDLLVVTNVHTMHNIKRIGKKTCKKKFINVIFALKSLISSLVGTVIKQHVFNGHNEFDFEIILGLNITLHNCSLNFPAISTKIYLAWLSFPTTSVYLFVFRGSSKTTELNTFSLASTLLFLLLVNC